MLFQKLSNYKKIVSYKNKILQLFVKGNISILRKILLCYFHFIKSKKKRQKNLSQSFLELTFDLYMTYFISLLKTKFYNVNKLNVILLKKLVE